MSTKYSGGLITKNPVTPAGPYQNGAAPGVWTVEQALQYTKQGIWPIAGNQDPTNIYIEYLFSTYLYTGTGASQTITNGIDLSTKGGLVWLKARNQAYQHGLFDTVRGASKGLVSNTTAAEATFTSLTSFNTDGFSLGSDYNGGATYASWTFREQPKFFDVVTYTGNGVDGRAISHNLGSAPGCIIVKRTDSTSNWNVYHRQAGGSGAAAFWGRLNTTDADTDLENVGPSGTPTTTFLVYDASLGLDSCNINGATYVAYLFAHNAGGFGLTGTDNVISCGSVATTNSQQDVSLGYEPQWILWKRADSTGSWWMFDTMRGLVVDGGSGTGDKALFAELANAELGTAGIDPTATGFQLSAGWGAGTYIYIAIRRGPMKVPTSGTKVFKPVSQNGAGTVTTGFPVSLVIAQKPDGAGANWQDRLRGGSTNSYNVLYSYSTNAEASGTGAGYGFDNNTGYVDAFNSSAPRAYWNFQRAPSFFDEVCYTGTGSARTVAHNLTVAPELMIVKSRNTNDWAVYNSASSATQAMYLNATTAAFTLNTFWNDTAPTSSVFTVGTRSQTNESGINYVAYLFATCAGVSKVGSYTGTGSTQTINCGFGAGGSRFVLIKRTDSTGDWYVWDSARGMVSGTDPSLLLNSTAAEVNANSIYTISTGFQIVSTAAGINASGGTYIFLSIA